MIYSKSVEHALKALAHLAELPEGSRKMARQIAAKEKLPAFFLAKILQTLAREGILNSMKGRSGGFGLNKAAGKIKLFDVVRALDGEEALNEDFADLPNFRRVRSALTGYLRSTSIADLAAQRKRKRMAARRKKLRPKR